MKASCPHCEGTVTVHAWQRLRDVSCPNCKRLVFREERIWGRLWIVVCAIVAYCVGAYCYRLGANIYDAWIAYLPYICPCIAVAVISPVGNLIMFAFHQAKVQRIQRKP